MPLPDLAFPGAENHRILSAQIIVTGDEVLAGRVHDTNSAFLARTLATLGILPVHIATVGDDPGALLAEARDAFARADIVITSGGLGPTADDLTMRVMADAAGVKLYRDAACEAWIEEFFSQHPGVLTANNYKQADMPQGAHILKNQVGTACGAFLSFDYQGQTKYLALLPGPPGELRPMVRQELVPLLTRLLPEAKPSRTLYSYGLPEAYLETLLNQLLKPLDPTLQLATYAHSGQIEIVIQCATPSVLDRAVDLIKSKVGHFLISEDASRLTDVVFHLLLQKHQTLALAESCTAGMIAERLGRVPGISEVFLGGIVSYTNSVKMTQLGVPADLLHSHGAVSAPTAQAMATGALQAIGSDLALSVTGLAGPGGGSPDKPVGTVYFGLAAAGSVETLLFHFRGDRQEVRRRATNTALDLIRRKLSGYPLQEELPTLNLP